MRERVGESRTRLWLLVTANRWLIAGIITVASFILLVLLVTVGPSSIQKFLMTNAVGGYLRQSSLRPSRASHSS